MQIIDPKMQKLFSQAYILGGSPCSGKSTVLNGCRTNSIFNITKLTITKKNMQIDVSQDITQ